MASNNLGEKGILPVLKRLWVRISGDTQTQKRSPIKPRVSSSPTSTLTEDEQKRLEYFMTAPLRSADRLMKKLYTDDKFYEQTTHIWVEPEDAKKLFLYGVSKEVLKTCVGLISDREMLDEVPHEKDPDRMSKIVLGSVSDAQTYRIRKMIELLSLLILFDSNTKKDEEYRVYLSAENLDLALARQEDFQELYEKRKISNTQHSIDDFAKRIRDDLQTLGVTDLWFLNMENLKKLKAPVFKRKRRLFLDALLVASPDQRVAMGISYGRGYSRTSQSIHPLVGSHDYGKDENKRSRLIANFTYLSMISMDIMHLAYKLAGIDDPEGLDKIMGANFEKSEASRIVDAYKKDFQVGDLVLTAWMELVEIVDKHTSKYGYRAYKIKYLSRPPLAEFPEDWLEAQSITARLLAKGRAREFFEKNTSPDRMPSEIKDIWPDVMKQSDDQLFESAKGFYVDMHKHGILIPMLLESGFLKKRDAPEL